MSKHYMPGMQVMMQHISDCVHGCRFKEEAEGAIAELKEQVAGAHQDRHALEQQAKDQVWVSQTLQIHLLASHIGISASPNALIMLCVNPRGLACA